MHLSPSLSRFGAVALFAAFPLVSPALAQEAELSLDETAYRRIEARANLFTASSQDRVALTEDLAGNTILVWQSRRQEEGGYGIFARRFDRAGAPIGDEIRVNAETRSMQMLPVASVDGQGGIWFAWRSFGQDGDGTAIVARRFAPDLASATAEVVVNATSAGDQTDPVLAGLPDGGAFVAWTSPGTSERRFEVRGRSLTASAACAGDELRLDGGTHARNVTASIVTDDEGRIAVAFAATNEAGVPAGIFLRELGSDRPVRIDEGAKRGGIEPALALLPDGGFAVAWFEAEADGYAARLRRFARSEDGLVASETRPVTFEGDGYVSGLALEIDDEGRALLAWSRFGDGPRQEAGLFAQLYDENDEPLAPPFRVTREQEGKQKLAAATGSRRIVRHDDGRLAFAWHGNAGLGDGSGAHLTLLVPDGLEVADAAPVTSGFELPPVTAPTPHDPPTFDPRRKEPPITDVNVDRATGDIDFLGVSNTGWTPPDPHLAAGPSHVVVMTNGEIAFFQKDGTNTFRDAIEGSGGFWGAQGATGFVFDPEVIYDPHSGRFMAMANERSSSGAQDSYYLLAVSDDSDPHGSWHKYRINATPTAGGQDIDSPNIAVDANVIYLSADFFNPSRLHIMMVDKSSVLSGGTPSFTTKVISNDQSQGFPVTYDPTAPAQYMVGFKFNTSSLVKLYAITNPLTTPVVQSVNVTVPSYSQPANPPQQGTTTRPEMFEARFWSAVYRDGSLWATHHVNSSSVRQRWYEFDMRGWPTSGQNPVLVQSGEIDLGGTIRTYFGSIWVDVNGVMALTFARSSPTEYISMQRTWRAPSDPLGTTRTPVTVRDSTSPDTSGRWGDYSAIVSDPVEPGYFWAHHEYRATSWRTRIAGFHTGVPGTALFRNDSGGTNPTGYSASPLVIGTDWQPTVDNTGSGNSVAGVFGFANPDELYMAAWGEYLLVDITTPELFHLALQPGLGVVGFTLSVPNDPAYVGYTLATQGVGAGGTGGINLHNAYDLEIGSI